MGLFDKFKTLISGNKLDVAKRFDLEREAVTGTMSQFYVARDRQTGKLVGLKLLDAEKTAAFEGRFQGLNKPSEGEIALQLKHPRIAETFEHGVTTSGQPYLVVELIEGQGLSTLILGQDERLAPHRLALIGQMAEAIEAVHTAGFIHRDICPRNFICLPDLQSLKLIDFGLTIPAAANFQQPGNRTGTPNYMAPEIARRRPTDQRVDIFSLGVTFYQLLAFKLPWQSRDASGKAAMSHDAEPPTDIREHRPDLSPSLAEVVMRCIAAEPDERPANMGQLRRMLRGVKSELA